MLVGLEKQTVLLVEIWRQRTLRQVLLGRVWSSGAAQGLSWAVHVVQARAQGPRNTWLAGCNVMSPEA